MYQLLKYFFLTVYVSLTCCIPLNVNDDGNNHFLQIELEDLIDDDVILHEDYRFGHHKKDHVWDNNSIPFVIDSKLDQYRSLIKSAHEHISSKTCILFKERTDEQNYVRYHIGRG
ncbi:Astacin-like metalloprotease toxin, partial [Leptotrombidium deliense]